MSKQHLILLIFALFSGVLQATTSNSSVTFPTNGSGKPNTLGGIKDGTSDDSFVPIRKGTSGFYVQVSLDSKSDKLILFKSESQNEELRKLKMMLFLFTSHTLLPKEKCQSFSEYDCNQFSCHEESDEKQTFSFPYFNVMGYQGATDIFLGDFWQLKDKAIMSGDCDGPLHSFGRGTSGSIGLGFQDYGKANYRGKYPLFSISLSQNGAGGELWPSKNLDKAQSSSPTAVLKCSEDWHIPDASGIQVDDKFVPLHQTKIIFDINRETLALPFKIMNKLLQNFVKLENPLTCSMPTSKGLSQLGCTYHGELNDLPNLTFLTKSGQRLSIPLLDYVSSPDDFDPKQGSITLNLSVGSDSATDQQTYLTKDYQNLIIFDRHIMTRYYVVFDGSIPSVEFYLAKHQSNSNGIRIFPIILGGGGFLLILILVVYTYVFCVNRQIEKNAHLCQREERNQDNNTLLLDDFHQQDPQNPRSHSGPSLFLVSERRIDHPEFQVSPIHQRIDSGILDGTSSRRVVESIRENL